MKNESKWYKLTGSKNSFTWTAMIFITFVATIAAAMENTWFNTFVYNNVTPDPQAVAWMVSVSAITAALSAIIFGAVSDRHRGRWGRRKPFILFGFTTAGILTILFSFTDNIKSIEVAIPFIVIIDSVMMIGYGAAYDGSFQGYVTDITSVNNRGRIQSILTIVAGIAGIVTTAIAGITIDSFGYPAFFICIGILMIFAGVFGGLMLQDKPLPKSDLDQNRKSLLSEILGNFKWSSIVENKNLFLLWIGVVIWGCGWYAVMTYQLIYIMQYLGFTTTQAGLASVAPTIVGMLFAVPVGVLSDRWGRKNTSLLLLAFMIAGALIFSFVRPGVSFTMLMVFLTILMLPLGGFGVCGNAWAKDLFPKGKTAQFAGLSLIFIVTIPMIIGSNLGSFVIAKFGTPIMVNGIAGFAPTPVLFWLAAAATVLCMIPILFIKQDRSKSKDINE